MALFKISDAVDEVYKMINQRGVSAITRQKFDSTKNNVELRLFIECEYLRKLTVTYMNFSYTATVHYFQ